MRLTLFSILTAGILAGSACARTEATTPGNALAAPAAGSGAPAATAPEATAPGTAAPGTAAERTDAARAADPLEADRWREVTLPAGTLLPIALDTTVGSDISRVEQPVAGHLARPVRIEGQTVLPTGSRVAGVVTDATRSAKVKGRAHVAIRFDSLTPEGVDQRYAIRTAAIGRTAAATKQKDALTIGAPAAGGAIIGAIAGGKKGALIGTAVGGGAGTAAVLSTRGKEVHLAKGSSLTLKLAAPVTIRVHIDQG